MHNQEPYMCIGWLYWPVHVFKGRRGSLIVHMCRSATHKDTDCQRCDATSDCGFTIAPVYLTYTCLVSGYHMTALIVVRNVNYELSILLSSFSVMSHVTIWARSLRNPTWRVLWPGSTTLPWLDAPLWLRYLSCWDVSELLRANAVTFCLPPMGGRPSEFSLRRTERVS